MGGFPLIYDSFMGQIRGKIWDQNFLWGSRGGSAPLKEKTAHMESAHFNPTRPL
jgi:hypothetical protein